MVCLHTGTMGVILRAFLLIGQGKSLLRSGISPENTPSILCIFPFVAHQLASARKKRQMPPEKRTQLGVQILFTTGQMPSSPRPQPSARLMVPATRSQANLNQGGHSRFKIPPAISPRIIVASVGMKLSVA